MPLGLQSADPACQQINPLLFFAAACDRCYYTREINSSYIDWQNDTNFKTYRLPGQAKKHLDSLNAPGSPILTLGRKIDQINYPVETAVVKLLLAVFDEKLLDQPSSLDLARFHLRIAWLFRGAKTDGRTPDPLLRASNGIQNEMNGPGSDSSNNGFWEYSSFRDFLQELKSRFDEIPVNETEALTLALDYYLNAFHNGREIRPGLRQLQAVYLIAELSRRIGRLEQAREYFKKASEIAQEIVSANRNNKSMASNARVILDMSVEQGRLVGQAEKVGT